MLILTDEEKRTLVAEGYPVPTRWPLSKQDEKNLKKVQRKIKNKVYIDKLQGYLCSWETWSNLNYKWRVKQKLKVSVDIKNVICLLFGDISGVR